MSQIQETYELLVEIDRLLADIELKITKIEGKRSQVESMLKTFQDVERLALRWFILAKRMGLPEDVSNAVDMFIRLVMVMRMYQLLFTMLYSTNPLIVGLGLAGAIGTTLTLTDVFAGY